MLVLFVSCRFIQLNSTFMIESVTLKVFRITIHTHTFNGPFSGTTQVSRYQKGKNNLDFTEARDSERQWHQLGHMQVCTSHQTDNHASTPPLSFYRPDALPAAQPTVSKHWRHPYYNTYSDFWWRCNVLLHTHVAERWLSVVIFCMCCRDVYFTKLTVECEFGPLDIFWVPCLHYFSEAMHTALTTLFCRVLGVEQTAWNQIMNKHTYF